jgi:putative sigma-54 modulation protein
MNLSIVGRHIELTDGIKSHIETAIATLEKYNLDIISIRATIDLEEKKGKKSSSIEFVINVAHKNSIVVKHKHHDLYVAIDEAIRRADKVLNRLHDKIKSHRKEGIESTTYKLISQKEEEKEVEDEIIPMDLELYKPLEIEEALSNLKESDKQFYVFNDIDDKLRVIYKISETKFGLY